MIGGIGGAVAAVLSAANADPITYVYQWQRDNQGGGSYSNIGGAVSTTYTLVDADDGCHVRCVVTATNALGSASANSNAPTITEPVPANTVAPSVSGSPIVGFVASVSTGTWTNLGGFNPSFSYQWQDSADGVSGWANIGGATGQNYLIAGGEATKYLRCVVTATNTGGSTSANSNVGGPVALPSVGGSRASLDIRIHI